MAKAEKERKLKIISLILICNFVKARKQKFNSISETLAFAYDNIYWVMEFKKVAQTPTFENGGYLIRATGDEQIVFPNGKTLSL